MLKGLILSFQFPCSLLNTQARAIFGLNFLLCETVDQAGKISFVLQKDFCLYCKKVVRDGGKKLVNLEGAIYL